jgi:hypothetical protein
MNDEKPKTQYDAASLPIDRTADDDEHAEHQDEEHDGWSEIKRRPSDPG